MKSLPKCVTGEKIGKRCRKILFRKGIKSAQIQIPYNVRLKAFRKQMLVKTRINKIVKKCITKERIKRTNVL